MLFPKLWLDFISDQLVNAKAVRMSGCRAAHVHVPASTSVTTLTWYGSPTRDGAFAAIQGSTGTAITSTNIDGTAGCYAVPAEVLGVPWVKAVGNADGDITLSADYDSADV